MPLVIVMISIVCAIFISFVAFACGVEQGRIKENKNWYSIMVCRGHGKWVVVNANGETAFKWNDGKAGSEGKGEGT